MPVKRAVGIDLGTTNVRAASVRQRGRDLTPSSVELSPRIPAALLVEDQAVTIGAEAEKLGLLQPDRFVRGIKLELGLPWAKSLGARDWPPELFTACLLHRLPLDIGGPALKVAISVPPSFGEPARQAITDAAAIAGLDQVELVDDSVAAAFAWYLTARSMVEQSQSLPAHLLVCDLGGGTFGVGLFRVRRDALEAIALSGDRRLGGEQFDQAIADVLAARCGELNCDALGTDAFSRERLRRQAIDVKHALAARRRTTCDFDVSDQTLRVEFTRDMLRECTGALSARIAAGVSNLLSESSKPPEQIDQVLLVGGHWRMPGLVDSLSAVLGTRAIRTQLDDATVVRGAALYAEYLLAIEGASHWQPQFALKTVSPRQLAFERLDRATNHRTCHTLIPRGACLPAKVTDSVVTRAEDQRSIIVNLVEGNANDPAASLILGQVVVRDLPAALPKGWPLDLDFHLSTSGRLKVSARVRGIKARLSVELIRARGAMSPPLAACRKVILRGGGLKDWEAVVATKGNSA